MHDDPDDEPPVPRVSKDDRTLAVVAHVGGFFCSFVLPLVLWLTTKDRNDDGPGHAAVHAREAMNFQITLWVYGGLVSLVGLAALVALRSGAPPWVGLVTGGVMLVLAGVFIVYEVVVILLASVAAWNGRPYWYPLCIRLV